MSDAAMDAEPGTDATGRTTPGTDRAFTPESAGRPKSTASSEIVFEAKRRKRKGTPSTQPDDGHEVTFTVTIAMAVPTGNYQN